MSKKSPKKPRKAKAPKVKEPLMSDEEFEEMSDAMDAAQNCGPGDPIPAIILVDMMTPKKVEAYARKFCSLMTFSFEVGTPNNQSGEKVKKNP